LVYQIRGNEETMMIKHIFTDMDGTLLNSKGKIDTKTADYLSELATPLTLVSARAPMEMQDAICTLRLTTPQIAFNGGLIYQLTNDLFKIIAGTPINPELAQKMVMMLKTYFPTTSLSFYSVHSWYTERIDDGIELEQRLTGQSPTEITLDDYFAGTSLPIFKIMLIESDPEKMDLLVHFLTDLELSGVTIQRSATNYLEITSQLAKKSRGIQYIMRQEQLQKAEVAAFGDGHNDLPMLQMVGTPIVMANATDEIKQHAKHLTLSNDRNGVSYGIKKFLTFA
jgi:Cof subfamily protein (haloacid dehalogenase superfamily)